jgi:hypothetical protein
MGEPKNARYWRERAEEARARAARMREPDARLHMLSIARSYELLAQRAEERAGDGDSAEERD